MFGVSCATMRSACCTLFVKSLNLGTKIPTLVVEWRNLKHEFRGGSCLNCKGGEGYFAFEAEAAMLLT